MRYIVSLTKASDPVLSVRSIVFERHTVVCSNCLILTRDEDCYMWIGFGLHCLTAKGIRYGSVTAAVKDATEHGHEILAFDTVREALLHVLNHDGTIK